MIFSRRRGTPGRHARSGESRPGPRHAAGRHEYDPDRPDHEDEDDRPVVRGPGPYDISEAPDGVQRLDLGSLHIPAIDGVEVRVQASPEGVIQQVVLVNGDNALQLGAFAAPRTEGIWDEIRAEIRSSLLDDGVKAQESDGEYGPELRARVRTPEGLTDLRFIGIDGPRWMVRAVYQGPAAVQPALAGPLAECLAGLVVDRGTEAMPVRDALPLRLSKELADQAPAQPAEEQIPVDTPPNGNAPTPPRRRPSPGTRRT